MAGSAAETVIGAVVLVAAGAFLVYAANTAEVSAREGYPLVAKFRRAEGISQGGDVRIAGVKVGTIRSMELDPASYQAVLTLSIRDGIELPEDSDAKITSASLLGDSFIALTPGASDIMLEPGGEIQFTQGSVNLIDLATRAVAGSGGELDGGDGDGSGQGGSAAPDE